MQINEKYLGYVMELEVLFKVPFKSVQVNV
jgi:hypothetical protein